MSKLNKINVENIEISVLLGDNAGDFICLTDMARYIVDYQSLDALH